MVQIIDKLKTLITIRWVVFIGIFIFNTIMFTFAVVPKPAIYAAYLALFIECTISFFAGRFIEKRKFVEQVGYFIFSADLVILATTIYFHGGVENRWGILPSIVILMAGFYFSNGLGFF